MHCIFLLSRQARPLWGYSIQDLLTSVRDTEWGILQLGWLDIIDGRLYKNPLWQAQRRQAALIQRKFTYGAMAYVISRKGMKNVLDLFFDPYTGAGDVMTSNIRPLLEGRFLTVEAYLARVPNTYITVPSMFITEVEDSTIAQGRVAQASRMNAWRQSNRNHARMILDTQLHCEQSSLPIIKERAHFGKDGDEGVGEQIPGADGHNHRNRSHSR